MLDIVFILELYIQLFGSCSSKFMSVINKIHKVQDTNKMFENFERHC